MKLAFIGTHGTGKTTLCHFLAGEMRKRGLNVGLVAEIARKSPLPINRKTTRESQLWILTTQIASEIEVGAFYDYVVCDRSLLDNYAYQVVSSGKDAFMEDIVEAWLPTYDVLFKTPNIFPLVNDGVRDTNLEFQDRVDQMIDELLEERGTPYVQLPRKDQLEFVVDYLNLPDFKSLLI